jgi:ATP-binding protein involved in chromosome partitioning
MFRALFGPLSTEKTQNLAEIFGLVINSAYYRCPSCSDKHQIFGSLESARRAVEELGLTSGTISGLLGEVPMVSQVSSLGDQGRLGEIFLGDGLVTSNPGLKEVRSVMKSVADAVWARLDNPYP